MELFGRLIGHRFECRFWPVLPEFLLDPFDHGNGFFSRAELRSEAGAYGEDKRHKSDRHQSTKHNYPRSFSSSVGRSATSAGATLGSSRLSPEVTNIGNCLNNLRTPD